MWNKILGNKGEEIAVKFLRKRGFSIVDRNFQKPWGEIDIIAQKEKVLHFVEVKTLKGGMSFYNPADKIDSKKRRNLRKIIEIYLDEKKIPDSVEFQVDVIGIRASGEGHETIEYIPDVVL